MSHPERSEGSSRVIATCDPPASGPEVAVHLCTPARNCVQRGQMPHFVRHDMNNPLYSLRRIPNLPINCRRTWAETRSCPAALL